MSEVDVPHTLLASNTIFRSFVSLLFSPTLVYLNSSLPHLVSAPGGGSRHFVVAICTDARSYRRFGRVPTPGMWSELPHP